MGNVYPDITPELQVLIEQQPLFFVATAPLDPSGHVNVSPKGLDCLRVLDPTRVAYLDLTGSGNETSAHLLENGRITFMFCAFDGAPKIVRLYGRGWTVQPDSAEWANLATGFPSYPGIRQIIVADISRVQTSCGYAVPLMEYISERDTLLRWAVAKGEETLIEYRQEKNTRSIDGLPTAIAQLGVAELAAD